MSAPTLRSRQQQLTRDAIMQALVDLILDAGLQDFSVQQVADRAGVSHRTVYRHYPSREELLAELSAWLDDFFVARGLPTSADGLDQLGDVVRTGFPSMAEILDRVEVYDILRVAVRRDPAERLARGQLVQRLVVDELGEEARPLAHILHLLGGAPAFVELTCRRGLSAEQASAWNAWAVDVLVEAARNGSFPTPGD